MLNIAPSIELPVAEADHLTVEASDDKVLLRESEQLAERRRVLAQC